MNAKREAIAYVLVIGLGAYVAWSIASKAKATVGGALQAINPANPENVIAKGVDAVVQTVTGDPSASLGSKLYDLFNPNAPRADAPVELRPQPYAAALLAQFGGSTRTREDEAWMARQLYGADVQAVDVEDAELGQAFLQSNPKAMAADRLLFGVKVR